MGNSCISCKGKGHKKSNENKNRQPQQEQQGEATSLELKKKAEIITFQHKFPVIRPLLNNELYKSRVSSYSARKHSIDSFSNEKTDFQSKRLQKSTKSFSQISSNIQGNRAGI